MKEIPIGEFKILKKEEIEKYSPIAVTFNGEPFGVFSALENIIYIGDLHPRVQQNFRAMEKKVRAGMPPNERFQKEA